MFQNHMSEIFRVILLASLLAFTPPAWADDLCTAATRMDLNSTLRGYGDQGEPFQVELEVPSPGILSVGAAVPGTALAKPRLSLAHRACLPRAASEPLVLERSANHLVLAIDAPGAYVFRVGSQEPSRTLGELKLRSAFVAGPEAGGIPTRDGEDEEEIEIEADPLVDPAKGGIPTRDGEDEEEIEIEADPMVTPGKGFYKDGEDEEEIEIEADPMVDPGGGSGRSLHARLEQLCRAGAVDDHGDSFTCATFLIAGQAVAGEIRNGWGDDEDVFHFVLGEARGSSLWKVAIETAGDVEVLGALYDRSGQRLVQIGGDGGSRIVLAPGGYFLRVESRYGGEGAYALAVDAAPW